MSKILVTLPEGEVCCTGKLISFKAPTSSNSISAITIRGVDYTVCDSTGDSLCSLSGAWSTDSIISVVLDCDNKKAYAQNYSISRNIYNKFAYLESSIEELKDSVPAETTSISTTYIDSLFS